MHAFLHSFVHTYFSCIMSINSKDASYKTLVDCFSKLAIDDWKPPHRSNRKCTVLITKSDNIVGSFTLWRLVQVSLFYIILQFSKSLRSSGIPPSFRLTPGAISSSMLAGGCPRSCIFCIKSIISFVCASFFSSKLGDSYFSTTCLQRLYCFSYFSYSSLLNFSLLDFSQSGYYQRHN